MEAILALKPVWDGIWPAMLGTLSLLAVTMALTLVPGIGCGIYLACYAPPRKKQALETAVDVLAGIPSIVMGLFGFVLILSSPGRRAWGRPRSPPTERFLRPGRLPRGRSSCRAPRRSRRY